jgi:hypothetical protein
VHVEVYSEVTDDFEWLDDVGTDGETTVGVRHFPKVRDRPEPEHFGLLGIQLETLGCAPAGDGDNTLL